MKNTHKDRYDNKLHRFLKDLSAHTPMEYGCWLKKKAELYRKYGFTEADWHKAIRLTESGQDSRHFFKSSNCRNDKTIKELKYIDHCNFELNNFA